MHRVVEVEVDIEDMAEKEDEVEKKDEVAEEDVEEIERRIEVAHTAEGTTILPKTAEASKGTKPATTSAIT
jgi:hypothetical protein